VTGPRVAPPVVTWQLLCVLLAFLLLAALAALAVVGIDLHRRGQDLRQVCADLIVVRQDRNTLRAVNRDLVGRHADALNQLLRLRAAHYQLVAETADLDFSAPETFSRNLVEWQRLNVKDCPQRERDGDPS
jgi:hypothetical protein